VIVVLVFLYLFYDVYVYGVPETYISGNGIGKIDFFEVKEF